MAKGGEFGKFIDNSIVSLCGAIAFGAAVFGWTNKNYHPPGPDSPEATVCMAALGHHKLYREQLPLVCHPFRAIFPSERNHEYEPVSAEQFRETYNYYYTPDELRYLAEEEGDLIWKVMVAGGALAFTSFYFASGQHKQERD